MATPNDTHHGSRQIVHQKQMADVSGMKKRGPGTLHTGPTGAAKPNTGKGS